MDGFTGSGTFMKEIIENGYKTAVNNAIWVFEFLYALHKIKAVSIVTTYLVSIFLRSRIEEQIIANNPQKIIIFHFFLIKPVYDVLKRNNIDIPVITVVTDPFTAHPIWFLQKDQRFIVFSEMLRDKCVRKGIDRDSIRVFPFVLACKFSRKLTSAKALKTRKELGFNENSKIILVLGGGDGMPHGKKILKKVLNANMDAEIAIVCGTNRKMYSYFMKLKEKNGITNLKIYGFVDFVHSLINISDVVITKCGASTLMEILLSGKIPLINNYIWEQEKGNMEFVCKSKMGILEKNTKRIPFILNKLLTDKELYSAFSNNIRRASIINGVEPVSDYILNLN